MQFSSVTIIIGIALPLLLLLLSLVIMVNQEIIIAKNKNEKGGEYVIIIFYLFTHFTFVVNHIFKFHFQPRTDPVAMIRRNKKKQKLPQIIITGRSVNRIV